MTKPWINFHNHGVYSLLDGASKIEPYAARVKELGQPGFTFTDHGNVFGIYDSIDAAESEGLKYFPGMEAYQARKTRHDRDQMSSW